MERRDFLKCVFATALAPTSVVKVLYRPRLSDRYIGDVITRTLNDLKGDPKCQELLSKHRQLYKDYAKTVDAFQKRFLKDVGPDTPMLTWKNYTFEYEGPVNFVCKNKRYNGVINFNHPKET